MLQNFQVNINETLMQAMQRAGVRLNAPCGGNHSCGKCRVMIVKGELPPACAEEQRMLSAGELAEGWRLACAVEGPGEWLVEVPEQDSGARVMTEGSDAEEAELKPVSAVYTVCVPPPTLQDQRADAERVCSHGQFTLRALGKLSKVLREGKEIRLAAFADEITDCDAEPMENLGVAVDVGTTTMAAYLVDLATGVQLACASEMNPQRSFGGDVISRADYACECVENRKRLQALVTGAIEQMTDRMLRERCREKKDVRHIVCVGNTIMMHLMAGLETGYITRSPFTPVYARSFSVRAEELGMGFENAHVTLGPCVAGYVGADTAAAALACGMHQSGDTELLIDIGTNGEIALVHDGRMLCCSAAAGPAFEGAHIRCGSGAQDGAIDHVRIEGGSVSYTVLGGCEAKSICGSGLVDAIAEMVKEGIADITGRIDEDEAPDEYQDRIFEFDGNPAFSLDGRNEEGVFISQQDLREVQLAKAAIAAGVQVLMNEMGIEYGQVKRLCLAGGFGNYIDQGSAVSIGLLPEEMRDRIVPVGNAAGTGARMMLRNRDLSAQADGMQARMQYIELSARPDFQELFVEKMMFGDEDY